MGNCACEVLHRFPFLRLNEKEEEQQQQEKCSWRLFYLPPHYATIKTTSTTIVAWFLAR